jgi:hypothetical protein
MTLIEILEGARDLLIKKGWCQHHLAVDELGFPINHNTSCAVAFCAGGACMTISFEHHAVAINWLQEANGIPVLTYANDQETTTKEMVIGWFDNAIKTAKHAATLRKSGIP